MTIETNAKTPKTDKATLKTTSWLLKQNKHYSPFFETLNKLVAPLSAISVIFSLVFTVLLNRYFGLIGQAPPDLDKVHIWFSILISSILATLSFSIIICFPLLLIYFNYLGDNFNLPGSSV